MAKTLVLLRHAKSAWPDGVADHDRPLTGRGRRDAPAAGRWLAARALSPQLAVVSSAQRAVETWALVAGELSSRPREVVSDDAYAAGAGDLLDLVRALPSDADSALLVGHNPGIGSLVGLLDQAEPNHGEFPTSAVAVFEFDGTWAEVNPGSGRLVTYDVPRG